MADVAEVRQRVLTMVEQARLGAAEHRARARVDEVQARRFIQETATPVVQQVLSILKVERLGAPDRERNSVHNDRITFCDFVECISRSTLRIDKVLGNNLKPIDRRMMF